MTHITPPAMNIAQRLRQIAARLGQLYRLKAGAEFEADEQEREYKARLVAMIPADGWPGKTVDDKKTAAQVAEHKDEVLAQMRRHLHDHRAAISDFAADIAALEAERRGLEWTVRAGLAKLIGGGQDEPAFEDQVDAWADDTVTLADWPADMFDQADAGGPAPAPAAEMQFDAPNHQPDWPAGEGF